MTERYITSSGQAAVWHRNKGCKMAHTADLVAVEEGEIPQVATPCSFCADGPDAQKIRDKVSNHD